MDFKYFVLFFVLASSISAQASFETSPSVMSVQPVNGSTDFVLGDKITILFDQPIKCGERCVAYFVLNNRVTEMLIDESMIDGKELTLVPQLQEDKTYIVSIPKGAIVGMNGMPFHGFYDYQIHTADISEPILIETVPAINGELDTTADIKLVFSKKIFLTGNWTASITCNQERIEIPRDVPTVEDNTVSIAVEFPSYVFCVLNINTMSLMDHNGNEFADEIVLPFNTRDSIAPVVSVELLPINDFAEASRISDIRITIDDQTSVSLNHGIDGGISVMTSSQVYLYTADKLSIADNVVTIANEEVYPHGEFITVQIPDGFFYDGGMNMNEAVSFNFTITEVTTQPSAVSILTTALFTSDILQIQFDSTIAAGSGTITLEGTQVNHLIFIDVASCEASEFTLSCPFSGAIENASYNVVIHADAVMNILGNGNSETVMDQPITIQTLEIPAFISEESYPKEGDLSVPLNTTFTMKWTQPVMYNAACNIQVYGYETPSNLHSVILETEFTDMATSIDFTTETLLPFTQYTVAIPAGCFRTAMNITNEEVSYTFTTTRNEAPSLLTFNLEGQQDVLLDAPMYFTFNQPLVLKEKAFFLLKPRDAPSVERSFDIIDGNSITIFNQLASARLTSKTQYTIYIPEGVICNIDDLCMEAMTLTPFTTVTESVNRVILQHTVPTSGATQVNADSPVVLHFTANVRAAAGPEASYYIFEGENVIEGTAAFDGRDVSLSFPLESGKTYTYVYDNNLFTTNKGSPVHYDIGSSFSFTVADTMGPVHYTFSVNAMQSVEILFDEDVVAGAGVLTVYNSANEAVVSSVTAGITTPDNRLVVYLNGQALPDDVYTFQFAAGFVKDIRGNESPAFTETFEFDRVIFQATAAAPSNAFQAIQLHFNKDVQSMNGEIYIDAEQRCVVDLANCELDETLRVISIAPEMCDVISWKAAEYTISIFANSIVDKNNNALGATTLTVTTPAVTLLEVDGEASSPAMGSVVSIMGLNTINIAFKETVDVIVAAQIRNSEGCVVATEAAMSIHDNVIIADHLNTECLSGTLYLIAAQDAIYSHHAGSSIAASTVETPIYSFSFKPTGPRPVSATAVFSNGLQIAANARIDITFNMEIAASEAALQQLQFVRFLDNESNPIEFAKRTHGEIVGNVLRIVVDEPFAPLLSSQIRSVVIVPMEDGLTNAETDVAYGTISLTRFFSLPPIGSQIVLEGEASIQPTIKIIFDQAVMKAVGECSALMVANEEATFAVSADHIEAIDDFQFTWTPSVLELLKPLTEYTFIADNTCFTIIESQTPASGISNTLVMTTDMDTVGPVVIGAKEEDGDLAMELHLRAPSFMIYFNEMVQLNENATIYCLSEESSSVVQIPAEHLMAMDNYVIVNTGDYLLSNVVYGIFFDNLVFDESGNMMQSMSQAIHIVTPYSVPRAVANVYASYVDTDVALVSFDAAVDMNLKAETGACVYNLLTHIGIVQTIEDVCVGPFYQGEPIRLSFFFHVPDSKAPTIFLISASNGYAGNEEIYYGYIPEDDAPIDSTPVALQLVAIEMIEEKPEERRFTFFIEEGHSYSHIIGYTFIVSGATIETYYIADDTATRTFSIDMPVSEVPISVIVKTTTMNGSSGYSDPLVIENPSVASVVPGKVDVEAITVNQISAHTISLFWPAPESREKIMSYTLYFADREPIVATTNTVELSVEGESVVFSIAASNMMGEGEKTETHLEFSSKLTATVADVATGATFAVATFVTSFDDVNVECALNAGTLIHAVGSAIKPKEVRVVLNGLVPSFHYSGLCWAYSTVSNVVSDSISLSFTTAAVSEEATLTVENVVYSSNTKATIMVDIDVPATVYCALVDNGARLVHSDIVTIGDSIDFSLDGPKMLALTVPEAHALQVMCTAEDSMHKMIGSVVTLEAPKPYFAKIFEYECNIKNMDVNVSIRPEIVFTFNAVPSVNEGYLVIENMNTHETITIHSSDFMIVDYALIIKVSAPLDHAAPYTIYTAGRNVIYHDGEEQLFMPSIHYGEITFTTTADAETPVLETTELMIDPSSDLALVFNKDVLYTQQPVDIATETFNKAVEVNAMGTTVYITATGLVENTSYKLLISECAFMDLSGNCFPATEVVVTTTEDAVKPYILTLDLADKINIPNDAPMTLTFTENVVLNNVNNIAVLANNVPVPLAKHNVIVSDNTVTIQLDRGYNMGYAMNTINVQLFIEEDAFRDLAGHPNELFTASFTAVGQRCGSSYLSTFMEDACTCHSENGRCWCNCGIVNLFEL